MEFEDNWAVAERDNSIDSPAIVRFRNLTDQYEFFLRHPHLIQITWNFLHPTDYGLPLHAEVPALDYFESLLTDDLERFDAAVLVAVTTLDNQRHFFLYASDLQNFVDRFHLMPRKTEPYPVSIEVTSDDAGVCYQEIVNNCSDDGSAD